MTLRCRQNVAQPQPTLHKITHVEKPPSRHSGQKTSKKSHIFSLFNLINALSTLILLKPGLSMVPNFQFFMV